MQWSSRELKLHIKAAKLLIKIKDEAFDFIRNHPQTNEYLVQQFVMQRYKHYGMVSDKDPPIVAFNVNTSHVHYFPRKTNSQQLAANTIIILDIWARLKQKRAPFADITWMCCSGKPSKEQEKLFALVVKARDTALSYLQKKLDKGIFPTGGQVDEAARHIITEAGYGTHFVHSTGHSIGFSSPHGLFRNVNRKNHFPLEKNLGYTIEPGIYLQNHFGVRTEIDFYIKNKKVIVTTALQRKLVSLNKTSTL